MLTIKIVARKAAVIKICLAFSNFISFFEISIISFAIKSFSGISVVFSPFTSSVIEIPSSAESGSRIEISGKPFPFSHFETAAVETFNFSASSFCVSSFSVRSSFIKFPVLIYKQKTP